MVFWNTSSYKVVLKSKKNIPGFNEENGYKITIEAKSGDKIYDIISNFNNFRSPNNQIKVKNLNNFSIYKDIIILIN